MRYRLAALLISAAVLGSTSLSAQDVSGVPLRPQRSISTVPPTQIDPNQPRDQRPAGPAPRASAGAVSPSEIRVTWSEVPEAIGYIVRRNPETAPQLLTPTAIPATELVDKELFPNTRVSYEVWADFGPKAANSPGRSGIVSATTPPPMNPSGFTANTNPSGSPVYPKPPYTTYLRWTPAPGAAFYEVKSNGQLVYEGAAPSAVISNVPQGEHYYDLLAYYGPTGRAIADTSAPAHVWGNAYLLRGLTASVLTQPVMMVKLSWSRVSGATGYNVTRFKVNPQTQVMEDTVWVATNWNGNEVSDAGQQYPTRRPLLNGATYRYYVGAVFPYHGGPGYGIGGAVRITLPP